MFAWMVCACGARTDLEVDQRFVDVATPDVGVDAPECRRDRECDDGLDCTRDECARGVCVNEPRDNRCDDTTCTVGRCDFARGCVPDPISCDDGIPCTVDICLEEVGCGNTPDDALCPISHRCDLERNCVARALITDTFGLYEVELPNGTTRLLTETGPSYTDIALAPDRQLYGVNFLDLFTLTDSMPLAMRIGNSDAWVALDVGPDGLLYAAGQNERVVQIELETLDTRVIARLPPPFIASGDIAFVDGRMLITITDEPSSEGDDTRLAEINRVDGSVRILGRTGHPCIWALAAFGPELYGFTCLGDLLRIDPVTAETELVRNLGLRIGGAAAR